MINLSRSNLNPGAFFLSVGAVSRCRSLFSQIRKCDGWKGEGVLKTLVPDQ